MSAEELARLAVEEAGIAEERLEDALQRQVLSGGHLDTVLLEMGLIDEGALLALLSKSSGLPAVGREAIERADPTAVAMFPRRLAEKHGIIPLELAGRRLSVAVADLPDLALLDEIGFMLSVYVRPYVTTEARVAYALYRLYGVALSPRIENLLGLLGEDPEEARPPDEEIANGAASQDAGEPRAAAARPFAPALAEPSSARPDGWDVVDSAADVVVDEEPEDAAPAAALSPLLGGAGGEPAVDAVEGEEPAAPVDERAREEARERLLARLDAEEEAERRGEDERREQRVRWTVDDAIAELALAGDRDQMLDVALRFAYRRLKTAGVLVVQRLAERSGGEPVPTFVGWDLIDPELRKQDFAKVAIPVEGEHALAQLWHIRSHFLGPLREGDPLLLALGRTPRAVVLVPILVGDHLAGVLYGDCGERAIPPSSLAELHMVVPRLGKALRNLILRKKGSAVPRDEVARVPRVEVAPPAVEASIPVIDLEMDEFDAPEGDDDDLDVDLDVEVSPEQAAIHERVPELDQALERLEATSPGSFARTKPSAGDELDDERAEPAAWPPPPTAPRPKPPPLPIRVRDALVIELRTDEGEPVLEETPLELPVKLTPDAAPIVGTLLEEPGAAETDVDDEQIEQATVDDPHRGADAAPEPVAPEPAVGIAAEAPPVEEERAEPPVEDESAAPPAAVDAGSSAAVEEAPAAEEPVAEEPVAEEPVAEEPVAEEPVAEEVPAAADAPVVGTLVAEAPPPAMAPTRLSVAPSPGASARESLLLATWREWLEHDDVEADELVGTLHQPGEAGRTAIAQVCSYGERAMPALARYFPGVLTVHPFGIMDARPDVTEFSDASACLVRLGPDLAAPILVGELAHEDRLHRYAAVWTLSEVLVPSALPRLAQRVFDPELRIALLALEVLEAYRPQPAFPKVLALLRDLCRRGDTFQRTRAIVALSELRDRDALDVLVDLLGTRPKELAEEARRALVAITRQDFRQSERRWRAWIADHGKQPRMRWLIDALAHKDLEIREAAQLELNRLTAKNFGFRADAPRKDREASIQSWLEWWGAQKPDAWT